MQDPAELQSLVRRQMNRFRGKTAGFIEALDLTERQERSLISNIKSWSYDAENSICDEINPSDR